MDDRERSKVSRRGFLAMGCCAAGLGVAAGSGAARAQGAQAGRGAVDVHAHYFPERFVKSINEQGGPPGVSFDLSNPNAPIFNIGGGRIPIDVTYWDLPKRIERMDAQGVTRRTRCRSPRLSSIGRRLSAAPSLRASSTTR